MLHTPVTSAPKYFASWTAAVPRDPEAPYTRTFCPFRMPPLRRKYREQLPPQGIAAASSKVTFAGFIAREPPSRRHVYSAYELTAPPKTSSPTLNPFTSFPTASTLPATSDPRMGRLGLIRPANNRTIHGSAFRTRTSPEVMVVAKTLTKI